MTTGITKAPKTLWMLAVEEDFGGAEISDLILKVLEEFNRDQDAAKALGITPQVLSRWIRHLGIYPEVAKIRADRKTARAS